MKKIVFIFTIIFAQQFDIDAQNMILNGGFEASSFSNGQGGNPNEFLNNLTGSNCSGTIDNWYSCHGSPNLTSIHFNTGQVSGEVLAVSNTNGTQTSEGFFQKNVNFVKGVKYTLSFYYYLTRSTTNLAFPGLSVNICNNLVEQGVCGGFSTANPNTIQGVPSQNIFLLSSSANGPPNSNFIFQTVTFEANDNYNNLQFYSLNIPSMANPLYYVGIVYIDDICLTSPCCEVSKEWQNITDDPTTFLAPSSLRNTRVADFIKAGAKIEPTNQGDVIHNHNTKLIFQAGKKINLTKGFYVKEGSPFNANLKGCNNDFWVNLQYAVNNCDITLWCNPCGGCGPYTYIWKDENGNILTTPSPYTILHVGMLTENKTYTVTVTDVSSGQTYSETITVGPCGCLKPVGPPASTITICSAQDACPEIGIARVPKMTYSWTASDQAAQAFISSSNTSYTKVCIPESYRNLGTLKVYLSITNECNDVVITQYSFTCCAPQFPPPTTIDICNKSVYHLGGSPQWGYTYQWTANSQTDLDLLDNLFISNPTITLDPHNPLHVPPNLTFPKYYYVTATNACGDTYNQQCVLVGNALVPISHYITPGFCWNASLNAFTVCEPVYHISTNILEVPYFLTDPAITAIDYKHLIVEVYNGGVLVKTSVFNYDDADMISFGNSNSNTFIKNANKNLFIPLNLDCNKTRGVIIYYQRDCDIFPIYGFNYTNNPQCIN